MRYLLLVYSNPVNREHPLFAQDPRFLALPQAEQDALTRESSALHREVAESGELVEAVALADPGTARTVRDGVPVPTDGPCVEAKEQLAGGSRASLAARPASGSGGADLVPVRHRGMLEAVPAGVGPGAGHNQRDC